MVPFAHFDSVAHPVAIGDLNGVLVYANQAFQDLTFYERSELLNGSIVDVFDHDSKGKVLASLKIAIDEGGFFTESNLTIKRKNKRKVPVDFYIGKIDHGEGFWNVFSLSDLTNIIKLQEEKGEALKEVNRVSRLADIGRISTGIGKELKDPLQVLNRGCGDIRSFLTDRTPNEVIESVGKIEQAAESIERVIIDLAELTDGESVKMQPTNILEILNMALFHCKSSFDEQKVLVDNREVHSFEINCDRDQIERILVNIFNNAVYAMSKMKNKQIVLRSQEKGDQVVLEVTNNGKAIPNSIKDRIMSPFFTTKPREFGSGLGLAVSHGIMNAHGGDLQLVKSNKIETTFALYFPKYIKKVTAA